LASTGLYLSAYKGFNMLAIGIDIGGTKIAGALVDANGQIVAESKVPTPATDPDAIVDAVVGLVN
jgi:glucokinase